MSPVFFLTQDIAKKLYTETCDCLDFEQLKSAVEKSEKENNIEKYLKDRHNLLYRYNSQVFIHTNEFLTHAPCMDKEFVLSNTIRTSLIGHLHTLKLIKENLLEIKAKKTFILIPPQAKCLLEVFGNPGGLSKSIEIYDYLEIIESYLKSSLALHEKLVKTCAATKAKSLQRYLTLEIFTLQFFNAFYSNSKSTRYDRTQNGFDKLAESSDTPI